MSIQIIGETIKREKEKNSAYKHFPILQKVSERLLLHYLPQVPQKNARKDRHVAQDIILSGSFLFQSPAS